MVKSDCIALSTFIFEPQHSPLLLILVITKSFYEVSPRAIIWDSELPNFCGEHDHLSRLCQLQILLQSRYDCLQLLRGNAPSRLRVEMLDCVCESHFRPDLQMVVRIEYLPDFHVKWIYVLAFFQHPLKCVLREVREVCNIPVVVMRLSNYQQFAVLSFTIICPLPWLKHYISHRS